MAKRGFEPDDVWRLRSVNDPRVSPDGRLIAFVVGTPDREEDCVATRVWLATADGSEPPRPFSAGPLDTSPRWSPDGRALAFLSDRGHGPQLVVARTDGGEPELLTEAPHGVAAPAWSPDGRRLAYAARTGEWTEPSERSAVERNAPRVVRGLRYRFDGIGWFDERRRHLFVRDLERGTTTQVTDGDWDDDTPAWSPDGRSLAFVSDRSETRHDRERRDVWVVGVGGSRRPRRLTRGRGDASVPAWSPDGHSVAYVGHEHEPGDSAANLHVMVVDADRSGPPRPLSAALDRTVLPPESGATHAWSADGAVLRFVVVEGGRHAVHEVASSGGQPRRVLAGDRQIVAFDEAAGTLAFVAGWSSSPPELHASAPDGSSERRISDLHAELTREVRWAPTRRVTHRAADGREIETWVVAAPGRAARRPALLEIHGGPQYWHPQTFFTGLYQALAAAGYAVVLPNPRGSHGYGEEFAAACIGDWGGADFADLMGALDALVDSRDVDPGRCYVSGYSYGGFMTSWVVGHTDRFAAACIGAPVTDTVSMWGTTDIPDFMARELGCRPWEDPEAYATHSPVASLPEITTPVQLLHWEGDLRCPIGQSEELFQGLRALGREVVMVRYPGGFHARWAPSQLVDYVRRHLDWFDAHPGAGA